MTLFDEVLRKKPETPDGNIFGGQFGGPTMDRTATSDWRSEDAQTSPIRAELAHRAAIAPITPNYATTSLPSDHFTNQSNIFSNAGTVGLNLLKGAGQKFQDFQTMLSGDYARPMNEPQDIGSIGSRISNLTGFSNGVKALGTVGSLITAPLNLSSLLTPAGRQAATQNYKTLEGGTPGLFDVPAVGRALQAGAGAASGAFGQIAEDQSQGLPARALAGAAQFATGALPNIAPLPFLPSRGAARPRVAAADLAPRALPQPARPLALPAPRRAPAPDVIPARAAVVDTTARPVAPWEQQIADSIARQKAAPTPTEALANRAPISTRDTGGGIFAPVLKAKPQTLAERTGALTPIGREDLTLPKAVAKPVEPVAPISLDDLRSRIGARSDTSGVPLDAEQLSARIGAKTRAQTVNSLNNSLQVEARTPATGTLGNSGMSGPLVGRAIGRGNSQLARTGIDATGLEAKPGDLSASLARQAKVHDANEAAIAAAKSGDQAALARAKADVQLLGGDLKHTEARIAQGRRVTTDATTTQDFQASIDALKAKKKAPPGGIAMIQDTKAGPQSPASSLSRWSGSSAPRAGGVDSWGVERPTLIGKNEIAPATIGAREASDRLYRAYAGTGPAEGSFMAGKIRVHVVDQIPARDAVNNNALAMTKHYGNGNTAIFIKRGLSYEKFGDTIVHELEHAGQSPSLDLVAAERRAYAAHDAAPSTEADAYAKRSENWPQAMDAARSDRAAGAGGLGRAFLRDDGMSREDIAAAKARLADRMGVDPTTGRSPNEPRVTPRTATAGGPTPRRITANRLLRGAEQASGITKTIGTALSPAHFMLRHALPVVSYPGSWLGGSVRGLREGFTMSPEQISTRLQFMKDNATRNGMGNLRIDQPHGGIITGHEDVPTSFMNKVPVLGEAIRRSNLGFTMGINEVRYSLAKELVNTSNWMAEHGLAEKLTMADRQALADTANVYTGRGIDTSKMGDTGKAALRVANITMFSPQMEVARVKMLGYSAKGLADIANNLRQGKAPNANAIARARLGLGWVIGAGSLYLLMNAAGGKTDTNLLSGTGGKTDIGAPGLPQALAAFAATETGVGTSAYPDKNVTLDPTASESTILRAIAREAVAIHDQLTGNRDLQKGSGNQQEQSPKDVALSAVANALFTSPLAYPIYEWLSGFAVSPTDAVTPMPLGAALRAGGIQPPTVGGKTPKTTGSTAPRSGPAPTRRPVAAPTRKAG